MSRSAPATRDYWAAGITHTLEELNMKIEHILLDYSQHFLVVDGTRGPLQYSNTLPAIHPDGYFRYRSDAYNVPETLRGILFRKALPVSEEKKIDTCEPANKAFTEWTEITKTCNEVVMARYEEAKP